MLLDNLSDFPIFDLNFLPMPIDLFIQLTIPRVPYTLHLLMYLLVPRQIIFQFNHLHLKIFCPALLLLKLVFVLLFYLILGFTVDINLLE